MVNAICLKYNSYREKNNFYNIYKYDSKILDLGDGLLLIEQYFSDEPSAAQLVKEYKNDLHI